MSTPRPRIQHVSVPRPPGSADQARAFYGGILGFAETPIPRSLRMYDLVWYRLGDTELHLFAESPHADPSGRHFCIEVEDLAETRARLMAAGVQTSDSDPIYGRPRFFCRDPFGNTIEFTRIVADYRMEDQQSPQTLD